MSFTEQQATVDRDAVDKALGINRISPDDDRFCSHCREAVRWDEDDRAYVTKYGNDPQCDASPTDYHNNAIKGN